MSIDLKAEEIKHLINRFIRSGVEGFIYKIIEEKYINESSSNDKVEEFSSAKEMKKSDGQERNQKIKKYLKTSFCSNI